MQKTLHPYIVKSYYLVDNQLILVLKMMHMQSMYDCPGKDIRSPNFSCELNCYSECPGVFVPGAEINGDKDV